MSHPDFAVCGRAMSGPDSRHDDSAEPPSAWPRCGRCSITQGRLAAASIDLDMEGYHDLELTEAAFISLLDEPRFRGLDAVIVLQAYLPDSFDALQGITAWAALRGAAATGAGSAASPGMSWPTLDCSGYVCRRDVERSGSDEDDIEYLPQPGTGGQGRQDAGSVTAPLADRP